MPLDEQECGGICNCRSGDEVEALRYVLHKFFTRMDDGHYSKRMAEEVAKSEQISDSRRRGGLEKARRQRDAVRAQVVLKQNTSIAPAGTPTPTPTPTLTTKEKQGAVAPDWLPAEAWSEFKRHRRAIRKPMTALAEQKSISALAELRNAGMDPTAVIEQSIANGWTGLFPVKQGMGKQAALEARNAANVAEFVRMVNAPK